MTIIYIKSVPHKCEISHGKLQCKCTVLVWFDIYNNIENYTKWINQMYFYYQFLCIVRDWRKKTILKIQSFHILDKPQYAFSQDVSTSKCTYSFNIYDVQHNSPNVTHMKISFYWKWNNRQEDIEFYRLALNTGLAVWVRNRPISDRI